MADSKGDLRRPWVAVALSFLATGVGHVYCGRIIKGLTLYGVLFVTPVLWFVAAMLPASAFTLVAFMLAPLLLVFAVYFYAAVDAFESAKRSPSDYRLKDYNRAGFYWLLIAIYLACPIAAAVGIRSFVFEAYYIPERSMSPSVLAGDRIIANKLIVRDNFPQRGDVIVFRNPHPTGGPIFIKRVVAVAGDKVAIDGNEIKINGKKLGRDRIPAESIKGIRKQTKGTFYYESNAGARYKVTYGDGDSEDAKPPLALVVPDHSVFLLGDNRDRSRDSRHFGSIHVSDVIGDVQYTHYPAQSWSRFGVFRD